MHACVLCFPFLLWQVLFVHRYSGSMPLGTAVGGAANYLVATATMVYAQRLSCGVQDPPVDLRGPGVVVFAVGLAGNFYHHCLLSRLRADDGGGKGYKIPRGGLFGLVACPNYLFEIVGLFGVAMIAQTVYALAYATGAAAYLAGRSCATRRWYQSKFDEFPARIKALVPYVL
jgi:steroid 5-alpha reductase family enzyme